MERALFLVPLSMLPAQAPEWITANEYAITALIPGSPDTFEPLSQKELTKAFHLEVHREKRTVPVFLLRRIDETDSMKAAAGMSDRLTQQLSRVLDRPVVDETGIPPSRPATSLTWKKSTVASISDALRDQLGLQLVEANRELEFLVIDNVERLSF